MGFTDEVKAAVTTDELGKTGKSLYESTNAQVAIAVHVLGAIGAATLPLWYNSDALEGEEEHRMKFIRGSVYLGLLAWAVAGLMQVGTDNGILQLKELLGAVSSGNALTTRITKTLIGVVCVGVFSGLLYLATLEGGKHIWFFKTNVDRKTGVNEIRLQTAGAEEIDTLENSYEIKRHENRLIRMKAMLKAQDKYMAGDEKEKARKVVLNRVEKTTRLEGNIRRHGRKSALRNGAYNHGGSYDDHRERERSYD